MCCHPLSNAVVPSFCGGLPGGEGAAVQPGHQPDSSAAGGQRPGGSSHHPVCKVGIAGRLAGSCWVVGVRLLGGCWVVGC